MQICVSIELEIDSNIHDNLFQRIFPCTSPGFNAAHTQLIIEMRTTIYFLQSNAYLTIIN